MFSISSMKVVVTVNFLDLVMSTYWEMCFWVCLWGYFWKRLACDWGIGGKQITSPPVARHCLIHRGPEENQRWRKGRCISLSLNLMLQLGPWHFRSPPAGPDCGPCDLCHQLLPLRPLTFLASAALPGQIVRIFWPLRSSVSEQIFIWLASWLAVVCLSVRHQ